MKKNWQVTEAKNMDDWKEILAESEVEKPCPVCGDLLQGWEKCCDKCMQELVGL